jgi:hypothetical protein
VRSSASLVAFTLAVGGRYLFSAQGSSLMAHAKARKRQLLKDKQIKDRRSEIEQEIANSLQLKNLLSPITVLKFMHQNHKLQSKIEAHDEALIGSVQRSVKQGIAGVENKKIKNIAFLISWLTHCNV